MWKRLVWVLVALGVISSAHAGFMSLLGVGGSTVSSFSPSSLSPALWLEAGDGSTIFKSNACSTAASANTDPVGCIQDKSGNSFNMTSVADDTTRPLLLGVGTRPYLSCDGSNDLLRKTTDLGMYASGSGVSVFAAVRGNPAAGNVLFASPNSIVSVTFYVPMQATGTGADASSQIRDTAGTVLPNGTSIGTNGFDNTDRVVGFIDDTTQVKAYVDGTNTDTDSYARGGGLLAADSTDLCAIVLSGSSAALWTGRVYNIVVVLRVLNSTEIANLTTYLSTH